MKKLTNKLTNNINNLKQAEVLNNVKTKVRAISNKEVLFPKLKLIINSIHKFIVINLYLDRINTKVLAILVMFLKIFFKGTVYVNVVVAVLVFLSHALDLEYKLTWELFTYLIPALIIAFNTYFTDIWGRISSFLKWLLEKFTTNLQEVKETVEKDVERVVNSVTQTEPDPKPKDNWKYYKYAMYTLGALAILYGSYYYWDDYTKPILMSPWYALRWCYWKVRGRKPRTTQQPKGPYEPDYAGAERDLEMNKVPSTSSSIEPTKGGFFNSLFNRVDKGKSKELRDAQPGETIFSVGEYSDPFSDVSNSTTPTPSTPKAGSPSRSYFEYNNSLLNTKTINKNK